MFNRRKLAVLLLFSIILMSSISAISAADSNSTDVQTADNEEIELEQTDSNQDVLSAGNSFADLNELINTSTSSEIELDYNYAYSQYIDDKNYLIVERDNIVIDGKGHTITGSTNTNYPAYGFTVNSKNVVIKNIHFVRMGSSYKSQDGGAILSSDLNNNLTVINCTFESCFGEFGGAISRVSTVENCSFKYCYGDYGGAASSCGIIRNSNFTNCNAHEGGAVSQCDSVNCNFINNYAGYGGAGRLSSFINCTFNGNSASYGGAVCQAFSGDVIFNCTFINNHADNTGGALYSNYGLYYVINSTFEDNTAYNNAVSIRAHLLICSFKNNTADNGVVYESGAIITPTLYNPVSSYSVTCPNQVAVPINYAFKTGTGNNDYFTYQGKVYCVNGINTSMELCVNYSTVIATYNVLSGSSWTENLDKGRYYLNVRSAFGYSSQTYYIYVYGEPTSITAENYTEMYVDEDKYLVADLTGGQNNPLEGFNVYLKENGNVLDVLTTNESGQVRFSLKNLPYGTHNLYLEFLEDARHEASNLAVTVDVRKYDVMLKADNVTAFASEDTNLVVNLTDMQNNPMAGYAVYLSENGRVLDNLTTDSHGQVIFSLNSISAGSHNLHVEFLEDDYYYYSVLPVSVVIKGSSTSIKANNISEFIRDDLALPVTLYDEDNHPMAGYLVYLKENGIVLDSLTTDSRGQVSFPLIDLSSGNHRLDVEFSGNRFYESSVAHVTAAIYKFDTVLNADNITALTIDDITLLVTLTDGENRPLSDCKVYLKENGNVLDDLTTDDYGQVRFSLNDLSVGSHNLFVEFLENRYYESSILPVSVVIDKTAVIINASNVKAFPNEGKIIALLTDERGNRLIDSQLYLNLAYFKNKPLINVGNGIYEYELAGMAKGNYTGKIIFNENDIYKASVADISVEILNRLNSNITADNITVFTVEYGTLTAYLNDSNGQPIVGEDVKLTINSHFYKVKTDSTGHAEFDLSLFKLPAGSYDAVISLDLTNKYLYSSTHVNVTVLKLPTKIIASDVNCSYGEGKYLVVTVKDKNDNPIKRQEVFFKINNRLIDQGTDNNGNAEILINLYPGNYTVEIIFNGTDSYNASSAVSHVCVNPMSITPGGYYSGDGHNQSGLNPVDNSSGSGQNQSAAPQGNNSQNQNPSQNATAEGQSTQVPSGDSIPESDDGEYVVITLKDDSGNLIINKDVIIDVGGQVKNYKSNGKGQVKILTESIVPKTYKAKVTVLDSNKRPTSTFNIDVVVKKANVKITAKKKTFKAKKKVKKYTIYLKAGKKPVKKVQVTLKIKGKTYKVKTNNKGKAVFKLKKLTKKGSYKAVITFKGNSWYNKATKTVKITVK